MAKEDWGQVIPGGYFHEGTHRYRDENGVPVLSTTQTFQVLGLSDFSRVPEEVLLWKRQYGVALHKACELLLQGSLDWDSLDDALIAPVTGLEEWFKSVGFEMESAEERKVITVSGMRVGMTLDARGKMDFRKQRRNVTVDVKTGTEKSPCWDWQLGSYSGPGELGVILQVAIDGRVTPHYLLDTAKYKREFGVLLAAANLAVGSGIVKVW